MKLEAYAVRCPECKGMRYLSHNLLCPVCSGVGQILIPDLPVKPGLSPQAQRVALVAFVMVLAVSALIWVLWP